MSRYTLTNILTHPHIHPHTHPDTYAYTHIHRYLHTYPYAHTYTHADIHQKNTQIKQLFPKHIHFISLTADSACSVWGNPPTPTPTAGGPRRSCCSTRSCEPYQGKLSFTLSQKKQHLLFLQHHQYQTAKTHQFHIPITGNGVLGCRKRRNRWCPLVLRHMSSNCAVTVWLL